MLKVLIIEHFLPGNTYTLELCSKLKNFVDLTMMCRKDAFDITPDYCKNKLYVKKNNKAAAVLSYGMSFIATLNEILFGKYDAVHIQTFKNLKAEIKLYGLLKKIKKFLLVHTVHNILPHEAKDSDKRIYKGFYNICDLLIVHNEFSKKLLVDDFGIASEKIFVIPHGTYETQSLSSEIKNDKETCTYLCFGGMRKYKGIDVLLNAVSLLSRDERKNKKFIVAGRHDKKQDNTDYEGMVKSLKIDDCVTLIERRIDDKELPELFGKADVCVFPYREIYGSGALLMAYTYNKPVIVSNVPAFIEETDNGKTGLIFESENPKMLAERIVEFAKIDKGTEDEFVKEIKRLVNEKYNWEMSAKKTVDVYSKL